MKKELTERRALEICIDMWDWLAENPRKAKEDWPGWETLEKEFPARAGKEHVLFVVECPCCEFRDQEVPEEDCSAGCPLYGMWGTEDGDDECCDTGSYFDVWGDGRLVLYNQERDDLVGCWPDSGDWYYGKSIEEVIDVMSKNAKAIADAARTKLATL